MTKWRGDISKGPLEQFQIDWIYMPKCWFENRSKYASTCIDVFNKTKDVVPLKNKEQTTTRKAKIILLFQKYILWSGIRT